MATFSCATMQSGSFLSSAGTFFVPGTTIPSGTPYLWPGLQDSDTVLQPVLDGRNNAWYYGNAFVGPSGGPYGNGQSVGINQQLGYYMRKSADGQSWAIESSAVGGTVVDYTYTSNLTMTQAEFCIETYNIDWTYGSLVFQDVTVVAEGTDYSWCQDSRIGRTDSASAVFEGLAGSVTSDGANSQCYFDKLTITPASN